MKPPPRKRSKPDRYLKTVQNIQHSRKPVCTWQRTEQRNLLAGLKRLNRTVGGAGEIDYAVLKKDVPQRSISEIHSVVEVLKAKVITLVKHQLMSQRREERRVKKPIELWMDMASAVAGKLEEPISVAFSQMLMVSSTEPRSLKNSDPPQLHRQPTDQQIPVGRTIPFRPMTRPAVPGQLQSISISNAAPPLLIRKTLSPTMGPARRLAAPSQVVRVATTTVSPPQRQSFTPVPRITSVATPRRPGTTEMSIPTSRSLLQAATSTVTPIFSNQAVKATQQPLTLTPISSAAAAVKAMTFGIPSIQGTPQPTASPKVLRVLTATTLQPQWAQTTTVASLSPGLPSVCSPIGAGRPQPQQPPDTVDTSIASSRPLTQTTIPTPASPCMSAQHLSTAISSGNCLKSSSIPVIPSSSSASIPSNLCSTSTIPPSSVSPSTSPTVLSSPSNSSNSPPSARSSFSSTAAEALHAKFGRTSKYAEKDSPRAFGIKCIVDFEKIYCYLSSIHNMNEECALTPMESAIVLDLLMSLPEELPLLDCNKLQCHMIQVYSCLSAPADSKMAKKMFEDLKPEKEGDGSDQQHANRDSVHTHTGSGQFTGANPVQDRMDSTSRGNAAGDGADSSGAKGSAVETVQAGDGQTESQSLQSNNTSWQSRDWEKVGLCPLNPFMIPLKLLMRKQK